MFCQRVVGTGDVSDLYFGSDEQKNTWLPALQKGEKLGRFGRTEPYFGSNPAGMRMRARKVGKEYALKAKKCG